MNERLVNIVKRERGGRKGPHEGGIGEEGYEERRDTGGGEYMCTRAHVHAIRARMHAHVRRSLTFV